MYFPELDANDIEITRIVFSGKIIDYIFSKIKILGISDVPGLKIKITNHVICPKENIEAEVYPFGYFIDCSTIKLSLEELQKIYKIGDEVSVVGYSLGSAKNYKNTSLIVFTHLFFGHIGKVPKQAPFDKYGLLNFFEFRKHQDYSIFYEDYEYYRCLLKLKDTKSKDEKFDILRNIAAYGRFNYGGSSFFLRERYKHMIKKHHLNRKMIENLMKIFDTLYKEEYEKYR